MKMRLLFMGIIYIILINKIHGQLPGSHDTIPEWPEAEVVNPCSFIDGAYFVKDIESEKVREYLLEVFNYANNKSFVSSINFFELFQLSVNDVSEKVCFAPFLKLIDSHAVNKANLNCGATSRIRSHVEYEYCLKKELPFVIMLSAEILLFNNKKLKANLGRNIVSIGRIGNNRGLTNDDYIHLLNIYKNHLNIDGSIKKPVKLSGYGYKWKIGRNGFNM